MRMKRIVSIFSFLLLMWGTMVAQTTTYYVTATTLNVRNKPQPNATIVGKLTQGMCIQVWEITKTCSGEQFCPITFYCSIGSSNHSLIFFSQIFSIYEWRQGTV